MFLLTEGRFVAVGGRIKVSYLGSVCELEVVELVAENGEVVSTVHSADEEADVSDRLSSVHLSAEPDSHQQNPPLRFFRCISGTCVKVYNPPSVVGGNIRAAITLDDIGGCDSQKDFFTRLVSSMLDVDRANAIKKSGKLYFFVWYR